MMRQPNRHERTDQMTPIRLLTTAGLALAFALPASNHAIESGNVNVGSNRLYGTAQRVGNGTVRTYVVLDEKDKSIPLEIGVAMSETSLDSLPSAQTMSADKMTASADMNMAMSMYLLDLPAQNPTPYKFVQFDWNPVGHEPAGVYDVPHFDFHFYTVPVEVRNSIVPSDPQYAAKAARFPASDLRAPFYVDAATPAHASAAAATVPQMGLHWLDVRSPELQTMAGHAESFKPFTKTFIYGSWDGQFIFAEPMITRAYILSKRDATDPAVRDETIPVSTAPKYAAAGYYPSAYRITYDAQAKEYRIALTQLARRD
jgi:hypothetical protein